MDYSSSSSGSISSDDSDTGAGQTSHLSHHILSIAQTSRILHAFRSRSRRNTQFDNANSRTSDTNCVVLNVDVEMSL